MEKRKPVRFIRKRGRIIPIYSKKEKRLAREGSQSLITGLGTMTAGGFMSGQFLKMSKKQKILGDITAQNAMSSASRNVSLKQLSLFGDSGGLKTSKKTAHITTIRKAKKAQSKAFSRFAKSEFLIKRASSILKIARVSSSAGIGLGIEKLIEASGFEKNNMGMEHLSETIGVGSAVIAERGTSALVKKYGHGEGFRSQVKSSSKKINYKKIFKNVGGFILRKKGIKL